MSQRIDPRLPRFTQGLGVILGHTSKFYPMDAIPRGGAIEDRWDGRPLRVERGSVSNCVQTRLRKTSGHGKRLIVWIDLLAKERRHDHSSQA